MIGHLDAPWSPADVAAVRERLLAWYDEQRRDLPWRGAPGERLDPYRVWLSEVMLQQTRVETVKAFYRRWIERFPDIESLARAPLEEVLKAWEGLGYYSRARNLHKAAREVAARYGAAVPADAATFRQLPGVGRYTAGAVMSIAFGRPEPIVDGNVRRVFARLGNAADPKDSDLWARAGQLVPGERPGDLNQALMELGATLCKPRSPECARCPVQRCCGAHAAGSQSERPLPKPPRVLPHEDTAVAVVNNGGALLLARRPLDARLGGLWEFPGAERRRGEPVAAAAERAVREGLSISVRSGGLIGEVGHAFTHVRVTYRAVRCRHPEGEGAPLRYEQWMWASPRQLDELPMGVAQRKIAALSLEPTIFPG